MKIQSEQKSIERLKRLKSDFRRQISETYEYAAKSCLTCETQGACCLDAHFVNVHISRLEAAAIKQVIGTLPENTRDAVEKRCDAAIKKYGLTADGDTYAQTYACPLFEKGIGCLVHRDGKPLPCMTHACYETAADLPPDELQTAAELRIERLNRQTYGKFNQLLPLPIAIQPRLSIILHKTQNRNKNKR